MPYFKDIFVSEEVGYQKPMKEYFDFVLNGFLILVEKTMIIGDSLHSDIQEYQQAKIQTVCSIRPPLQQHQPFNPIIRFNS